MHTGLKINIHTYIFFFFKSMNSEKTNQKHSNYFNIHPQTNAGPRV